MIFSKVERDKRPARTLLLPTTAFADSYTQKPPGEVAVGLRYLSQSELDTARREAERIVRGFYEEFAERKLDVDRGVLEDVYNDAFVAGVAARVLCDPNDVTRDYFEFADDTVKRALTPEAMRRVWDETVILHKGSIEARPEATAVEIAKLSRALPSVELDAEAKRLCAYLYDKLGVSELQEVPDADEAEEEEAVYVARTQ